MWSQQATSRPEGRQQPLTAEPAAATRSSEDRRIVARMGKSVVVKGHMTSSEDMTVDGRVEGSIEMRGHTLTVGPDGDIRADVVAKAVTVSGAVTGTITAVEKVEIRDGGSVDGRIVSPRLAMADGALLRGRVNTEA